MSFKSEQKRYNKEVMRAGDEATKYLRNSLGLINQYTTDYSGRTDFWTNKLNNRELELLQDQYLNRNAQLLRGAAQFGSNSQLNRQIQDNAYSQSNYLADVHNKNVQAANALQMNELQALMNASNIYQNPIASGASAAQNVDSARMSWANALGQGLQTVGNVVSFANPVVGAGISTAGGMLSGMSSPTTELAQQQYNQAQQYGLTVGDELAEKYGWNRENLSTSNGSSGTTLSVEPGGLFDKLQKQGRI